MSLSVQFLSLLAMIGTGIGTAAIIDLIGTGIASVKKTSIIRRYAVLLEVIGWFVAGCWTFYILYLVRDGGWRIYDPFAQISGMLLYMSMFHKPIRFLGRVILILLIKPIWFLLYVMIKFVQRLLLILFKIILFPFTPFISLFRKLNEKYFIKKH